MPLARTRISPPTSLAGRGQRGTQTDFPTGRANEGTRLAVRDARRGAEAGPDGRFGFAYLDGGAPGVSSHGSPAEPPRCRTLSSAARERTGGPWPGAASALNRSWAEAWPGEECRWHREGRACRTQPPFAPRRRPRQGRAPKTLLRLDDVGCARSPVAGRRAHRARVARDLRSPGAVGGHGRGCRLSARRGLVDLVAVAAGFGHDRSGHDRRVQVVVEP